MNRMSRGIAIRLGLLLLAIWIPPAATIAGDPEYVAELDAWRAERLSELTGDDGFLNLAGLFWLRPGSSTFGSSDANALVFPDAAAPLLGSFELRDEVVRMTVQPGVDIHVEGLRVNDILMSDDTSENPVVATHGDLAWTVIRRDDRFAVRLRDFDHPALANFSPPQYFPVDEDYRVAAVLHRYASPRQVRVNTVIEGLDYRPESPGVVRFEIGGDRFELETYSTDDGLFMVFGDRTNERESYPAGRFLYADMPDEDGGTVLDFNKAHNPPCAFNDFATCPVASPRNRLPVRIAAGETYDPAWHPAK